MIDINLKENRYEKAHLANRFKNKTLNTTLTAVAFMFALAGIYVYLIGNNIGWILLIPIVFLLMVHEWYKYDLSKLEINKLGTTPTDLLEQNILGKIKTSQYNTSEIISSISSTSGYNFFRNRFLIDESILQQVKVEDTAETWKSALELWQKYNVSSGIDGGHLAVALIISASNKQQILKTLNYSEQELLSGLDWYSYLVKTISSISARKSSGGIARDWASGYTPLLNRYAQNISYSIQYGGMAHRDIFSRQKVVSEMISIFSSAGRANVALVGGAGSGKHICVQGLANELLYSKVPGSLKYAQIYQIDVSKLLSSVKVDNVQQVLEQILIEAYHAKNIILFFNNAGQLFGSDNLIDLSNFMHPIIEAGKLRAIYSFTDVQWQYIQRNKPALSAVFNYQAVKPTDEPETLSILENEAIFVEYKFDCLFTYESLKEIYRLASRYGPDISMPSKAISVMEASGRTGTGNLVTAQTVQKSIESSTGVKVGLAVGAEKDKLLNLELEIKQKVIGQDLAVSAVVSALKRNRSGVASSNKPIGTFLFLGPTGVGKTELSKTLASAYFGEANRFIRLDMNEYITSDSIKRLLAAGNQSSPTFLDKIKQQPFSVVLLDEIEKANPDIVNLFLQVLDEGFMSSDDNRQISFRDTIIIATSNAGADIIRESVKSASDTSNIASTLTEQLIQKGIFKPEFLNRFDETIIFKPLSQDQLKKVVEVLLAQINNELSNRKITVKLDSSAVNWLSTNGYDPAMGARPLRRLMQKTIETIVADKILAESLDAGDELVITEQDLEAIKT